MIEDVDVTRPSAAATTNVFRLGLGSGSGLGIGGSRAVRARVSEACTGANTKQRVQNLLTQLATSSFIKRDEQSRPHQREFSRSEPSCPLHVAIFLLFISQAAAAAAL